MLSPQFLLIRGLTFWGFFNVPLYTHIHIYIHIYIHTYIHTYIYINTYIFRVYHSKVHFQFVIWKLTCVWIWVYHPPVIIWTVLLFGFINLCFLCLFVTHMFFCFFIFLSFNHVVYNFKVYFWGLYSGFIFRVPRN